MILIYTYLWEDFDFTPPLRVKGIVKDLELFKAVPNYFHLNSERFLAPTPDRFLLIMEKKSIFFGKNIHFHI